MAVSDKLFTFDVLFALIIRDYLNKTHYRFIYEVLICKFIVHGSVKLFSNCADYLCEK